MWKLLRLPNWSKLSNVSATPRISGCRTYHGTCEKDRLAIHHTIIMLQGAYTSRVYDFLSFRLVDYTLTLRKDGS